ncbi:MAG: hypothetical protein CMN32_04400 [Saprospirales bacterium]|nr:hypothetical protein [Saprospirales bacterium]
MKLFLSFLISVITITTAFSTASIAPQLEGCATGKAVVVKPPRWEKLGQRKVDYKVDRDEILVTAREGRFTALKLTVKKGGINMHKMVIHFADGSKKNVDLRAKIPAGGSTRVIDLPGNRRIIRKVVFVYDTKNFSSRKAVVELWGRH